MYHDHFFEIALEIQAFFTFPRISIKSETDQQIYLRFIVEGRLKYSEPRVSASGTEIAVVLPSMEEGRDRQR